MSGQPSAVDAIYVLVGYKIDQASVSAVRATFNEMRANAGKVRAEVNKMGDAFARQQKKMADESEEVAKTDKVNKKSMMSGLSSLADAAKKWWPIILGMSIMALAGKAFKDYTTSAGEILTLANATNSTTQEVSELAYVFQAAGVPVDDLRDGLNDLSEKATEAKDAMAEGKGATNEYAKAFKELNLDVNALQAMRPADRFTAMADALNSVTDPARRSALVMKLMSDEGTKFFSIFNMGSAGIKAMRLEAQQMGAVLGDQGVADLIRYGVATNRLTTRLTTIRDAFGRAFTPVMADLIDEIIGAISVGDVQLAAKYARELAAAFKNNAGPALREIIALVRQANGVLKEFGGISNVLKLLAILFVAQKIATAGGMVALKGWTASALAAAKASAVLGAKILLIAAPMLIIEDYATWKGGGDSVLGDIFGSRTQGNIANVQGALLGVAGVLAVIVGLVFGVPAGIALAIGALVYAVYETRKDFEDFFGGLFGLMGIYFNKFMNMIKSALQALFVDLPGAFGEMLNNATSGLAYIGSSGRPAAASSASSAAMGGSRTSTSNQEITVMVNAPGAQDPQAIGGAASDGVAKAGRDLQNHYSDGLK
jgi:hypothetical protein